MAKLNEFLKGRNVVEINFATMEALLKELFDIDQKIIGIEYLTQNASFRISFEKVEPDESKNSPVSLSKQPMPDSRTSRV